MNFNKVFLLGNLTRDPELRQTAGGQSVSSFSIATNSFYTDKSGNRQQKTEFHNIVAWGRQAEVASQFLKKGSLAFIEGRLQTRTWQDNQGQARRTTEIICERLQLGPRSGGGGADGAQSFPAHDTNQDTAETGIPQVNIDDEVNAEDIPF